MDAVIIKLGQKEIELPREVISLDDLANIFQLEKNGLHLKVQRADGNWHSEYPSEVDQLFDTGSGRICYVVSQVIYCHTIQFTLSQSIRITGSDFMSFYGGMEM